MIDRMLEELAKLEEVEAIALGGSRAGNAFDEKSDYDVYLYCTGSIAEETRKSILSKYCSYMELGNHFWELEDNCILNNGIDIDILYRNIDDFGNQVSSVVEAYQSYNGYTTCMWHNLINSKILYDKKGRLLALKERFQIPYPKQLKENIINNNLKLLYKALPAYVLQIEKAIKREDIVSMNHRTTAFMESYFDIIFALNEMTHPGEKRLISLCKQNCRILPNNFEENLSNLFSDLFSKPDKVSGDLHLIINELKHVL